MAVMNLIVYYGRPPSRTDAISANIFLTAGKQFIKNMSSIELN